MGRTTTTTSMSSSRKSSSRKRKGVAAAMHPRNKYAENAPDFSLLASKYPAFRSFVSYGAGANNRPRIDWTDFNATRELTRVLLDHDYGIKWWIPDGQLCPTVTNRANYIHWIEDLLASCPAPWHQNGEHEEVVCGIDIGTGANCIYPLLGTALHKWHFVATGFSSNEFHHVLSVLWIFRACDFARSTVQISTCGKCLLLWKSYVCMHVSALIAEVHIAKYCE